MTPRAEHIGDVVRAWREERGLSLSALGARAGVSKSAISYWERGQRQPSIPELEAVFDALRVPSDDRKAAVALMDAPRARKHLQQAEGPLGSPPLAGELLRAMRLRAGLTQTQLAAQLGIRQHTVARWESSDLSPSPSLRGALCAFLGATGDEAQILLEGFSLRGPRIDPEAALAEVRSHFDAPFSARKIIQADYVCLKQEAALWLDAHADEGARTVLGRVYLEHAFHLAKIDRFEDAIGYARRGVALDPTADSRVRAILIRARRLAKGSALPQRLRAIDLLQTALTIVKRPAQRGFLEADLAEAYAWTGQTGRSVDLSNRTFETSPCPLALVRHCSILIDCGHPESALRLLPDPNTWERQTQSRLIRRHYPKDWPHLSLCALHSTRAYLALGDLGQASAWHARLTSAIEVGGTFYLAGAAADLAQALGREKRHKPHATTW